ncbi:MAG: hypothetical protein AAF847_03345, partial [Bacteroidota bacterium]
MPNKYTNILSFMKTDRKTSFYIPFTKGPSDRNEVIPNDFWKKSLGITSFLSEGPFENGMKNEVFHSVFKKERM